MGRARVSPPQSFYGKKRIKELKLSSTLFCNGASAPGWKSSHRSFSSWWEELGKDNLHMTYHDLGPLEVAGEVGIMETDTSRRSGAGSNSSCHLLSRKVAKVFFVSWPTDSTGTSRRSGAGSNSSCHLLSRKVAKVFFVSWPTDSFTIECYREYILFPPFQFPGIQF